MIYGFIAGLMLGFSWQWNGVSVCVDLIWGVGSVTWEVYRNECFCGAICSTFAHGNLCLFGKVLQMFTIPADSCN